MAAGKLGTDLAAGAAAPKLAALLEAPVEIGAHRPVIQRHAVDVPAGTIRTIEASSARPLESHAECSN